MKKTSLVYYLLYLISFFFSDLICYSQSTFTLKYSTPMDETPCDAVETADGGFIISISIRNNGHFQSLLMKIGPKGDTIRTLLLKNDSISYCSGDLLKSDDGNYFEIGVKIFPKETKIWLLKMNSNLTILKDTTYSVGVADMVYYFGYIDHFHNLIIYGDGSKNPPISNPFIYRLTQDGDSLSFKFFSNPYTTYVFSLIEKPDTSGYYMMIFGSYQVNTNSFGQILSFDYDLNELATDSIPRRLDLYFNSKSINGQEFFLTGKRTFISSNFRTDLLGILRLDTAFVIKAQYYLGPPDTINYPGYLHNLDFIDTTEIYYGGTCNQDLTVFSSNASYYLLGKFNADLNLQWQKFYGGDKYYTLWGILATYDHGCLLLGSTFDYQTQDQQRDVLIIKVDKNGSSTGSNGIPSNIMHDVILYPNPGYDKLYINTALTGAYFELFDVFGHNQIIQMLSQGLTIIKTQDLTEGMYFYRITYLDKLIKNGIWIKVVK
jgi:hypothetical protein